MDMLIFGYVSAMALSLVALCLSGDLSVRYTLELTTVFRVTKLFAGFAIVAISTSIPELSVVIASVWGMVPQLAAGDIIGSNVVVITLVLGVVVLYAGALTVDREDYPNIMMIYLIAILVMGIVFLLGILSWVHGLFLIALYLVCLSFMWHTGITDYGKVDAINKSEITTIDIPMLDDKEIQPFWRGKYGVVIKFCISMMMVLVSSWIVVLCAVALASGLGMGLGTIGSSIVSIGTALPELIVGIHAVRRKEHGLALGNSMGSVLMQGSFVLGVLALISREPVSLVLLRSVAPFMFIAFATIGYGLIKRKKLNTIEGVILLMTFLFFWMYQVFIVG